MAFAKQPPLPAGLVAADVPTTFALPEPAMSCVSDIQRALRLRSSFPAVEQLELLDLVFEGQVLSCEECAALELHHALTLTALAFVAAAFDRGMSESEWLAWQTPPADPEPQRAVRTMWTQLVLPAFVAQYTGVAPATADRAHLLKIT